MEKNNSNNIFVNTSFDTDILKIVIRRNWYWLGLITAVLLTGAFLYLRYTKPVYESKMLLQISNEDQGADVLGFKNLNEESSISREIELLRSQFLFEKAIKQLDLKTTQYAEGDVLTEQRYNQSTYFIDDILIKDSTILGHRILIDRENDKIKLTFYFDGKNNTWTVSPNELLETKYFNLRILMPSWDVFIADLKTNELYFHFNDQNSLVGSYISGLSVSPVDIQAKTIQISYTNNNAELAKDITQSVGRAFLKHDESYKKESAKNVLNFIDVQLDSLKKELNDSKSSIMSFQRKEGLPNPESISTSISSKLEQFKEEKFNLEIELSMLNNISKKIHNAKHSIDVYKVLPELMGQKSAGSLTSEVQKLNDLLESKEQLLYKVTPQNEEISRMNKRIQLTIESIDDIIEIIKTRISDKIQVLSSEINKLESKYFDLPQKEMELSRLKNVQNLNEKYYTLLTEKQVLYSISNAGYASSNKVLNSASVSNVPISPKKGLIYGAAIFMSFAFGVVLLFFRYVTFNEINQLPELQKILPPKVNLLGALPLVKQKMEHSKLIVNEAPKSMLSEAFRTLRTNLSFVKNNPRTIAITSSISGEGKTFVALNLAGILAMTGKKVVILDLDMRKPKIHLGLGADNDFGMSNLLSGQKKVDECIKKSCVEELDFITAGTIPPNPSELILSSRFNDVLDELKEKYDTVLIDNPPIGIVSDGVNVLAMADLPIYVFKANYSKRFFVNKLKEIVALDEIKKLSVVLNGVKMSKSKYGYGYGYYEEDAKKNIFKRKND